MKMHRLNSENTLVIACGMLQREVEWVMAAHGLTYPVIWIEKGLHEYPERLKIELEKKVSEYDFKEYIMIIYGMCGYAVIGLQSEQAALIVPKFDDCIRMLMCCNQGECISTCADRFYFTQAWADSDKFIFNEFDQYIEDYGEEDGRAVAEMMIAGYTGVDIIENGTYDSKALCEAIAPRAEAYNLDCRCVTGTLRVIEKVLLGGWDEEVVVKKAGQAIEMSDFDDRPRCI